MNYVAQRYALALFNVASECKEADAVLKDLIRLQELMEKDQQYSYVFFNNYISKKVKTAMFNELSSSVKEKFSDYVNTLVGLLISNCRMKLFNAVVTAYKNKINEDNGIKNVSAEFAIKPTAAFVKELKNIIAKALDKKIVLDIVLNKNMLGGAIIKYDHNMIDMSLATKLKSIVQLSLS